MISMNIHKGYEFHIDGKPAVELEELPKPTRVAVLPEKIPFVKPRLKVKEGDSVSIGSVLFEDKRNPNIVFRSPGGGTISKIAFGHRRVIETIVIELADSETNEPFNRLSEADLRQIKRDELVGMLIKGGLWHLIRQLPFRDYAKPDSMPPAILVSLNAFEPFQPQPEMYLKDRNELFAFGIRVLQRLTPEVRVFASQDSAYVLKEFLLKPMNEIITHTYKGRYPADDPATLLYHIKKSSEENRCGYVSGQDVLLIGQLIKDGIYPTERTIVLSGSSAEIRKHFRTRIGASLEHITCGKINGNNPRYIVGGLLRGYVSSKDGYMGFNETALTLIPEGGEGEFFGFLRPGYDKQSYSRLFLSVFNKSPLTVNSNLHGDLRACVGCNHCERVCPVDILPQLTFKAVLADEVEEYLAHGLLDCVECGLCSYVCPSKIEIASILRDAKHAYYMEQMGS